MIVRGLSLPITFPECFLIPGTLGRVHANCLPGLCPFSLPQADASRDSFYKGSRINFELRSGFGYLSIWKDLDRRLVSGFLDQVISLGYIYRTSGSSYPRELWQCGPEDGKKKPGNRVHAGPGRFILNTRDV